jgi:hypothetical protein
MGMIGPEEPSADLRTFASAMRQMYIALVNEGFSPSEALAIVGHVIAGSRGTT